MRIVSFMSGIWVAILIAAFGYAVYGLEQPFIVIAAVVGAITAFLLGVAKGTDE